MDQEFVENHLRFGLTKRRKGAIIQDREYKEVGSNERS